MKVFDAAKLKDMAAAVAAYTMLAAMAKLCIRFFSAYMTATTWFQTIAETSFFTCTYARKRIAHKVTHERKFALFTRCGGRFF